MNSFSSDCSADIYRLKRNAVYGFLAMWSRRYLFRILAQQCRKVNTMPTIQQNIDCVALVSGK